MSTNSPGQPRANRNPRTLPPAVERALRTAGANISSWRKLRGLTQAQVADRAGVSINTLRRLEDGDSGITFENLLRILRVLGVLEGFMSSLDPHESDIGRLRSDQQLPQRVRPRNLTGGGADD